MENNKITFEEFVEKYRRGVYKYILVLSYQNIDNADDIFQNTMLKAQKSFNKLNHQGNLWAQ